MSHPIRVLVVDDSALMRKLIPKMLERDGSIQVVGTAMDGAFALAKIEELKPDVITLDLEMPRMDGMETLREITRKHRIPVIVVSAHTTAGASATFKALALGAFDFIAKPADAASAHMDEIAAELIAKIKAAANGKVGAVPAITHVPRTAKLAAASHRARPGSLPLEFRPEDRIPCSTSWRSSRLISPAQFWSCSTCPRASPRCLPGG